MPYTWLQLQWLRNNEQLDHTAKYEVYRDISPGVTASDTKIMDVTQPVDASTHLVVSDTPENKSAHDPLKTYAGPKPYDFMPPYAPENLVITPVHADNKATITWDIPDDQFSTYYYRIRSIDTDNHPSDLSLEFSANLISELNPTPFELHSSPNGVDWSLVGLLADPTYEELNVDINGPNPVQTPSAAGYITGPGTAKITLNWTNPAQDNGTNTKYYRVRAYDNAATMFPGSTSDNISDWSLTTPPQVVKVEVTHGVSGVEIKYRNAKLAAPTTNLQFTTDTIYIGNIRIVQGSVIVRPNGGGVPFTEGVDYEVNYPTGFLSRITAGNIPAGASIQVDYQYNDGVAPTESDPTLASFDGTYFLNNYNGSETYDHLGLADSDCYNYILRVKDNYGNWSAAETLYVNIDDSTPPVAPVNLILTAFSA